MNNMNKKITWAAVTVILAGLPVGPARWALVAAPAAALAKAPAGKALSPAEVLSLANSLRAGDTAMRPARLKLIEMIAAQYLSDVKATRRISIQQWHHLATELRVDLAPKARRAWAAQLRLAFSGDNDAVKAMKLQDIAYLVATAHMLGDKLVPQPVFTWLKLQSPESLVASIGSIRAATALLMRADRAAARRLMKEFDKILAARDSETPLTYQQCDQFRQACVIAGCNTQARQWGMRIYQATLGTDRLRASAGVGTLAGLGNMLIQTRMVGRGKEYPEFAIVLARLTRQGKLAGSVAAARALGAPLGTDRTRKMVQAGLLNPKGAIQIGVAEVVAWGYKTSGQLKLWDKFLEDKARDKKIPADTRARWLLARAYSASIVGEKIRPYLGNRWLKSALATAKSQKVRVMAVQQLVASYVSVGLPATALAMLESIKNQFSGEALAAIEEAQKRLRHQEAERRKREARRQADMKLAHKRGWLTSYRRALRRAEAREDRETIGKIEKAIKKLEAEINP